MHGSLHMRLVNLLVSMFEVEGAEGLYSFVKTSLDRDIRLALRPGLALIEVIAEVLDLVEKHGYWGGFFMQLVTVRTARHEEIAGVASEFEVDVGPPKIPRQDRVRGLIGPLDSADAMRS